MALTISNPFSSGIAETIRSPQQFIELLEPSVLEVIPWASVLEKPLTLWTSAEGAGKSTILRALSPGTLRIVAQKGDDDPLFGLFQQLGFVNRQRIECFGVITKGSTGYPNITDLEIPPAQQRRLFFALLNASFVSSFVKGLGEASFDDGVNILNSAHFDFSDIENLPDDVPVRGSAADLQEWANRLSRESNRIVSTFSDVIGVGHDQVVAQHICNPRRWTINGAQCNQSSILMMDDFQYLTPEQRKQLIEAISRAREGSPFWLAARTEALPTEAIFLGGSARPGREYEEIRLENLWRNKLSPGKAAEAHRQWMIGVANRRLRGVTDGPAGQLSNLVAELVDTHHWGSTIEQATRAVEGWIEELTKHHPYFQEWVELANNEPDSWSRLVLLREVLIEIHRDLNSNNPFRESYTARVFKERSRGVSGRRAAHAMLAREIEVRDGTLPLYFGVECLALLASENVQTLLSLCEKIYEQALNRQLRQKPDNTVPADVQDSVVRNLAEQRWQMIRKRSIRRDTLSGFLSAMCKRLDEAFLRKTAPYAPGPIGLGIPANEFEALCEDNLPNHMASLREVLRDAISLNFLFTFPRKHHSKNYIIFWMDRMLLAHHGLPIASNQFQPTTLDEMQTWLDYGYTSKMKARRSIAKAGDPGPKLPNAGRNQRLGAFGDD